MFEHHRISTPTRVPQTARVRAEGLRRFALSACLVAVLVLLAGAPLFADAEADRQLLVERLELQYVADPAGASAGLEVLDNEEVAAGTENGAFWSNASMAPVHTLVRELLQPADQGGDAHFQFLAARVVSIGPAGLKVRVRLLDDATAALTATDGSGANVARSRWGGCIRSNGRAWPCARHLRADEGQASTYVGYMWLGAHYFSTGNKRDTFLHELVHTQDRTSGRAHLFTVGGVRYRYGADDVHYGVELVPDRSMTYKEGIANAVRLMYNTQRAQRYFDLFATNDFLLVEKTQPPAGSGFHPDAWLYTQLQAAGVPEETLPPALLSQYNANIQNNYAFYRIHNLPPRFVLHNEYVLASIIANYLEHVMPERFFDAVADTNETLFMSSGSGIAVLFETLCYSGLPEGMEVAEIQSSQTGNKVYLMPLAFADYFTGYRSSSKAEMAQLFEGQLPEIWIDAYWTGYRDAVRQAAPGYSNGTTPQRTELTDIALALGVTSQGG